MPFWPAHLSILFIASLSFFAYKIYYSDPHMSSVPLGKRMPSFFISHGGPPTLFDSASKPYKQWQKTGEAIQALQPKGIVVVSAHWESQMHSNDVQINEAIETPLIYDFYGFPNHFYTQMFPHRSAPWLVSLVKDSLTEGGVRFSGVTGKGRGLDHGVWVPFKVMFPNHTTDSIPILQVSLPGDGSLESSYKLGTALDSLRDQGIVIVGTGQPVHNLRDLFSGSAHSYGAPFLRSTADLVKSLTPSNAVAKIQEIQRVPEYKKAVPSPDHFMPLLVVLGTVREGQAKVEWELDEGPLGWGFYRVD